MCGCFISLGSISCSDLPSGFEQPTPWWGSSREPGSPSRSCRWTAKRNVKKSILASFDSRIHLQFDNRKVKNLEDRDGEGGSFSSARLGLSNHVSALDDRLDCTLLDGRGLLKTISIDSPEMHDK